MPLVPASGTGQFFERAAKIIRLVRYGCANRPFYHIVVMHRRSYQYSPCIEQLGTYDPMPNKYNEKLVSLNYDRVKHWLGRGAHTTKQIDELLGLCGYFPINPKTYMTAWRHRDLQKKAAEAEESKPAEKKNETT